MQWKSAIRGRPCPSLSYRTGSSKDASPPPPEPAPRGEETAERASDPRERAEDLAGEEGDRDSLVSIPFTRSNCLPPRENREERWRRLPPQREPSGSEAYAGEAAHNAGSQPPREQTLHASLQADHAQTV